MSAASMEILCAVVGALACGIVYWGLRPRGAIEDLARANCELQGRLASAHARLEEQARLIARQAVEVRTDLLTRLANRRALDEEFQRCSLASKRGYRPFSLILLDIDYFREVNDTLGHLAGDEALRTVAGVVRRALGGAGKAFRYGGEEFAIVLPDTSLECANEVAERIRMAIERTTLRLEGEERRVTVSAGVAEVWPGESTSSLLRRADQALYVSKKNGRNCTHWHDGHRCHRFGQAVSLGSASLDSKSPQAVAHLRCREPAVCRTAPTGLRREGVY